MVYLPAVSGGIQLALELADAARAPVVFTPVLTDEHVELATFLDGKR